MSMNAVSLAVTAAAASVTETAGIVLNKDMRLIVQYENRYVQILAPNLGQCSILYRERTAFDVIILCMGIVIGMALGPIFFWLLIFIFLKLILDAISDQISAHSFRWLPW